MNDDPRHDQLDKAIDELLAKGSAEPTGDVELDAMLRVAAGLRGLPDPEFQERLRAEIVPESGRRLRLPFELPEPVRRAFQRQPVAAVGAFASGFALAAAVFLLVMIFTGGDGATLPQNVAAGQFSLTPLEADTIGVEPDTAFVLTSDQPLDADLVRSLLRVDPPADLEIKRESSERYRITTKAPLEPGKVYRFSLAVTHSPTQILASWAFQTKSPITIVQTLPRGQASQVPVNTGIELTFSHEGMLDIASHFTIDPPVEGTFEVHKRVIVFVPKALAKGTLYTVTVTGGLGVAGSTDVMAADYVFQFETDDSTRTGDALKDPVFAFTRRLSEASTQEPPALELYSSDTGVISLPIEVYRYPDIDAFLAALEEFQRLPSWANLSRESFEAKTAGLAQVSTLQADAQPLGQYGGRYLQLPAALPPGFYLVQTRYHDRNVQTWLDVTDVATYVTVSKGKTLVWVNDLATKAPMPGAQIDFLGMNAQAKTDDQGIAFVDTPANFVHTQQSDYGYSQTDTTGNLKVTAPDGRSAIVPLISTASGVYYGGYYRGFFGGGYSDPGDDYWRFLSTDRPLYKPTDTANFWGVARRRDNPVDSETLTVEITGYDYLDYNYQPVRIAETEVQTTPLGTFTGKISFAGVSPGYYNLTVKAGDQTIGGSSLQVQTYTKPAYKIDVVPSKRAAFAGESIDFDVTASFFDGSPVPSLKLNYSAGGVKEFTASNTVTTDAQGKARVTFTAADNGDPTYVSATYLSFRPALAEEGEIIGEASVSVHPADLTFSSAQTNLDGDQGVITGTVNHVDLSRINAGEAAESYRRTEDYLGAPAAGVPVSLDVTEQSWTQREVGEYYDFIAKIVRKRYEYDQNETPLGTFTATTDAQGNFEYRLPVEATKYYQIMVSVPDALNRKAGQHLYLSGRDSYYNSQSSYVYLTRPGGQQSFFGGAEQFAIADQVQLQMQRGSDILPNGGDNRYLFYQARNGVFAYHVQPDSTLSFAFGEDNVPSTTVLGVWFNGRTYVEVNYGYQLNFDPAERELQIHVAPDQERYQPGDPATLEVSVTDKDGKPQADTEVNLAVVDEAIYRIPGAEQYTPDLLTSIYQYVGPGIVRTYASHQYPTDAQAAERGGDGGARTDFADLAFYGSVTTDSDGHASVSFDLPDNLTSWRVTARGFSPDLKAGTALAQIPVGLPFFVDVTMNDEYLVTDQPSMKVRSFGRALNEGQQVTFEVSAPSLGLTQAARATASAFEAAQIALPALREGEHQITIAASAGGMTDSLVRTIRVVPSRLVKGQSRFYELASGLKIEGSADRPTRLVFSDHERGRYLPLLQQLTWEYGDRVDQMLARDLAAQLLNEHFNDIEARGQPFDASLYQTPDGGVALFPYSDGDLTLSARIAALAPDRFGRTAMSQYFLKVGENQDETRERQIIALYGLASLGEPVLVPLQALAKAQDLTWRERLYLGLAALEFGDDTTARDLYRGLIDDFGESRAPYERLRVGVDQDDILEATSLAAILAGGLGEQLAPALFDYTQNNYIKDTLIELEQISYLANTLPRLSAERARFAYTLNGQRKEVKLAAGESLTLQVTPEELSGLRLETIEGHVGVAASFTAPAEADSFPHDPDISVTRSYAGSTGEPVTLSQDDLVLITLRVTFGPQALDGCYQLSDLLPSGLRPVTRPFAWGIPFINSYPYRIEGQRVSFCVTKPYPSAMYYARVINAGTYTAEPAIVQSMKSAESANISAPTEVEIR